MGLTETQESNFDITTLTLMRVNEICKKLDALAVSNSVKNSSYVRVHYGFLKAFYNNLQILLKDEEKTQWDKMFSKLEGEVFKANLNQNIFMWLDNTEMELRRLQQRIGFSVMLKPKIDLHRKLKDKLVGKKNG